MKLCQSENFYCWSEFNPERNIDFHSYLWCRPEGNVIFDPLPISEHDLSHLQSLGKVTAIIVTNSDHVRASEVLAQRLGCEIYGPLAERDAFPILCDRWIDQSFSDIDGLQVFELQGSKTPGELALLIEQRVLVTGDLIRCHRGGQLCLLPDAKLKDRQAAIESVKPIASIKTIETVLTGDGWPIFACGHQALTDLISRLESPA
jgi:glyoxylase-like metal-dependent hydrolase (beta-lactamase superfamily II)